jgi:GNAT superfamily N-acetyltransferase
MNSGVQSIGGVPVTTRLAMKMEDSLQAFAVRAACFIGELDVPFSEEFDGHDYGATHVIAYIGDEPIGTVRLRWFKSFVMCERLAVMQRFRGNNVGQLLLERCRQLAEGRGCNLLYAQVLPSDIRLLGEAGLAAAGARGDEQRTQADRGDGQACRSRQAAAGDRGAGGDRAAPRADSRFAWHPGRRHRELVS